MIATRSFCYLLGIFIISFFNGFSGICRKINDTMALMDPKRKFWNDQQLLLRKAFTRSEDHAQAIALFLDQHAMLHTTGVSESGLYSFEDDIWQGLSEAQFRTVPPKFEHSIAWIFWHLTRIEDITMNRLAGGQDQIYSQDDWAARLNAPVCDTASAMDERAMKALSARVDMAALRQYRFAVGRATRQVVSQMKPGDFQKKVDPVRIRLAREEGAVVPEAGWLLDYWGGLTIAGLLLMPPTRHIFVHLNEAHQIKRKLPAT
jgi:hypothetical protein